MMLPPKIPRPQLDSQVYGKVPPQALELEKGVLGALLLEKDKQDLVFGIIRTPAVFYPEKHQRIYQAMHRLSAIGSAIDLLTVTDALRKSNELDFVGGAAYLMELSYTVVSSAHVEEHARIVIERFLAREVIRVCGAAISRAYEQSTDAFDLLETTEIDLGAINDHVKSGSIKHIGASAKSTVMAMREAEATQSDMLGLPTGLSKLDAITLGLTAPDLIIVAAGTGEGKTTLALNIAENISSTGKPGGIFSLEMRDRQLVWKVLSGRLNEQIKVIRSGKMNADKWSILERQVLPSLQRLPIYIYDVGGLNIVELKSIARVMKKKFGIEYLVIDYIQLVRGAGKRFGTREEEVNFVSKELKSLAMELDIPILALSQLNRIEKGATRMYRLSDLRESGAIEQDADGVLFVYRPINNEREVTSMEIGGDNMIFTENDALIHIGKWRLGETGTFRVRYDGQHNKFSDWHPPDPWDSSARIPNPRAGMPDYRTEPLKNFNEEESPI